MWYCWTWLLLHSLLLDLWQFFDDLVKQELIEEVHLVETLVCSFGPSMLCINKGLLLQKCWIWKSSLRIWHMFLYHYCTSCPWLDFLLPAWNLNEVNGNFPKQFIIPTGQLWTPMRTSPWESLVLCAGKLLSAQLSWEGGCCKISTNFCCRWEFG
jgi:hypothetical protein